jgi:hypothetical protein
MVIRIRLRQEFPLRRATIGRFRVALSDATYSWPDVQAKMKNPLRGLPAGLLKALQTKPAERTTAMQDSLLDHLAWIDPALESPVVALAPARSGSRTAQLADSPGGRHRGCHAG